MCMVKTPVLLCTEAWFVHVCVAAQTNGALAHQNQNLHQNLLLQQWGSLCWLCKKKPKPKPKTKTKKMKKKISSAHRHRRRASSKRRPAFPCGHPALYKKFPARVVTNVALRVWLSTRWMRTASSPPAWAAPMQRLRSLRARVLTARTWVLPVFFKEGSPPRSVSDFLSLLRAFLALPWMGLWSDSLRLRRRCKHCITSSPSAPIPATASHQ